MVDVVAGIECFHYEWNGSGHDEFNGMVTNIQGGANAKHPIVQIRYASGGGGSSVANNVPNIEAFPDGDLPGEDYWRRARGRSDFIPPRQNHVLAPGDIVWCFRWVESENDHFEHIAFVRSVQGTPATDSTLNLSCWSPATGDGININNVAAWETFAGVVDAQGEDYWCTRNLAAEE